MQETETKEKQIYIPVGEDKKTLDFVYGEVDDMIRERDRTFRQFNDRTLVQFINDSEKRVQGYVPSKEEQGKEDWQSNVFNQATRNKLKAYVAAVATAPPSLRYKAVSQNDMGLDLRRAEVMENLVQFSRYKSNAEVDIFWEAWTGATQGTVIKYDGYLKTKYKRKFIKSYDLVTGELTFEEREVTVNDECIDIQVPISELLIKDFLIHEIQDQPALAWIRYLDKDTCEQEFAKFKNWPYVLDKSQAAQYQSETETFFYSKWKDRVSDTNEYEVIKYYNRFKDRYEIVINGVLILSAPMLWGRSDKVYPFSKTIFEPFSGKDFFYGNSLPNANMDVQDVINTLYNMSLDKTYRSLNPSLLAGIKNKDLLEMEDERMGMENTIYVEDINQVQYQKVPGITDSEMAMIKWVAQGMDSGTIDINQQGLAGRGVTAREIVIANENAKRLKGVFFMFLTDLWIQKTRLRILNILQNYTQPKVEEIVGPEGKKTYTESFRTVLVENSKFPDGQSGTLAIQFVKDRNALPTPSSLEIEEEKMKLQGKNFQKVAMVSTYLDDYDYDVEVISESLYQKDTAEARATVEDKIKMMALLFPRIFLVNQDMLFGDLVEAYGDTKTKYNLTPPAPPPVPPTPGGTTIPPAGGGMPQGEPIPAAMGAMGEGMG